MVCTSCGCIVDGDLSEHTCPEVEELRAKAVGDPVNHPEHYTFGKYEVIDVIEDWSLPMHLGNAVKYIARAGKKGPPEKAKEDIEKAIWYLERFRRHVL
jgi:hypothetical protein